MLSEAASTLGMDCVLVGEIVADRYVVRHAYDPEGHFPPGFEIPLKDSMCRHIVEQHASASLPDLAADPQLASHFLVTEFGFHAYAGAPIWVGERIWGSLAFFRRVAYAEGIPPDDMAFIDLVAAWFGQTLLQDQQRKDLAALAMADLLTSLPNRRAAEERLAEELARARRQKEPFAVAMLDLDRFKLVNDNFGHESGDVVLRQTAVVMQSALREGDWLARWGGEEFIAYLHKADANQAYAAMERVRTAVKARPVELVHGRVDLTVSVGIGVSRGSYEALSRILSEADGCLYDAKRGGRDRVVLHAEARRDAMWRAGSLHQALRDGRIVAAYQVIVDLATGAVVGDEALARLIEPDGTVFAATDFIEAAEAINLAHMVDNTVARQAMNRCAEDLAKGSANPDLAHFVNLSPQFLAHTELVRQLLDDARTYCERCGVEFGKIKPVVFEITERQLIGRMDELMRDLDPLLEFGFRLALDDFGSGYSSFLYLARLPVSFLKIEGWMVGNLRANPRVEAMVRSIVDLARSQGIITIAECIEDAETLERLRGMGVNWGQGYYFGRPELDAPPAAQA
jgi:diguanylate cyclase (GGDEF)-like protein